MELSKKNLQGMIREEVARAVEEGWAARAQQSANRFANIAAEEAEEAEEEVEELEEKATFSPEELTALIREETIKALREITPER